MKNELPQEPVTITLIDMDFIAVELDGNSCEAEVKWLRQVKVNSEEYRRGLEVALSIALELKKELRKTYAFVEP